jgi:hypothetical protein
VDDNEDLPHLAINSLLTQSIIILTHINTAQPIPPPQLLEQRPQPAYVAISAQRDRINRHPLHIEKPHLTNKRMRYRWWASKGQREES